MIGDQIGKMFGRLVEWHAEPAKGMQDVTMETAVYLPPAQITWLLFALLHYRRRQR